MNHKYKSNNINLNCSENQSHSKFILNNNILSSCTIRRHII